jgi:competence protein ComEC
MLPLFDTSLDMIIGTHPDADHIGGFADVLQRYSVRRAVYQHVDNTPGPADRFEQALVKLRLQNESLGFADTITEPHRGDVWDIGGGAYIVVLYPDRRGNSDDTNAGSMIVKVVYGSTSFLLTGDAPKEVEDYLVNLYEDKKESLLKSDILKLGHHGSHTSSSDIFLAAVHPSYAIISRGCDNTYGHPHKEVLESLKNFNIPSLDTCKEGTIVFESDGEGVVRR